jgi:hypothetical protein
MPRDESEARRGTLIMDAPAIIITPIALLPKELGEKEDFFSLFYHLIWQKYRELLGQARRTQSEHLAKHARTHPHTPPSVCVAVFMLVCSVGEDGKDKGKEALETPNPKKSKINTQI